MSAPDRTAVTAHATAALAEADRLMMVCNSCRYCEGLCAVFPAMEMRRAFADADLRYLANLCHACGACYVDCQFSPPHEFDVNVPRTLAVVRAQSYAHYAWPRALAPLLKNAVAVVLATAIAVAAFVAGFVAWSAPGVLFAADAGPGAFYRVMPHNLMAGLFGAAFLFAVVALVIGARNLWRDGASPAGRHVDLAAILQAVRDAAHLRYLDGGGVGCYGENERPTDRRRLYHHLTFYGFALCFASTSVATLYHYLLGREAPYPWYDLPVVLGTFGGIGLVVGPVGLAMASRRSAPVLADPDQHGLEAAFRAMLLLTGLTGLLLLVLRATPAMGVLLAVHLGVVLALFLTLPYTKMVHGLYRFAALVRYAAERRAETGRAKA